MRLKLSKEICECQLLCPISRFEQIFENCHIYIIIGYDSSLTPSHHEVICHVSSRQSY